MKKQWTPMRLARHMVDAIYEKMVPAATRELGLDYSAPSVSVRFLIIVEGHSPLEPLATQLQHIRETCRKPIRDPAMNVATALDLKWESQNDKLTKRVWEMVDAGTEPEVVQAFIGALQKWPWAAYVADREALMRELQTRYRLGPCEIDCYWKIIPCGMVIHCDVRPYAWATGGH